MTDVLFIWIPKAAGTSIHKAIGTKKLKRFKEYSRFNNKGRVTFGHVDVNYLLDRGFITLKFFNNAFRFCFVRNPWDRVVSFYFYKKYNEVMGLEKFLNMIKEIPPIGSYNVKGLSQLNNQSDWITRNGEVIVNYVGRYEKLDQHFAFVADLLNIDNKLSVSNKTDHKDYRSYYNDRAKKIVAKLYEKDIDIFKYTF